MVCSVGYGLLHGTQLGSQKAVFDSAIVLLLNISGATRSGLALDVDRELLDVYKCMTLLRQMELR